MVSRKHFIQLSKNENRINNVKKRKILGKLVNQVENYVCAVVWEELFYFYNLNANFLQVKDWIEKQLKSFNGRKSNLNPLFFLSNVTTKNAPFSSPPVGQCPIHLLLKKGSEEEALVSQEILWTQELGTTCTLFTPQ